ncbi:MAG TPA: hypothetical protein VHT73_19530 [Thermodesulfobacteriota bacterium]|nr:hypothetical protein [Thermodesulfobacteriota bacterium]
MRKSLLGGLLLGLLLGLMLIYAVVGRYEIQIQNPEQGIDIFIIRVDRWNGTLAVRHIGREMSESYKQKEWIEIRN